MAVKRKSDVSSNTVWQQLDDASGSLYNALDNLSRMENVPKEILEMAEKIDVGAIDVLKNEVEDKL